MDSPFPALRFQGALRPSQRDAIEIARRKLQAGHKQLHIVAPPGSGKTVLGLYLWCEFLRVPALVLSPNSAIQAQWAARVDLFTGSGEGASWVSTDGAVPGWLTSLTYQAVTLPVRGSGDLEARAVALWQERLVEKGQARDVVEAAAWIDDLKRHNREYHDERLGGYRKEVRDEAARDGDAMPILHASSLATLDRLKARGLGLIILDECHHLLRHWGRVLADVHRHVDHPVVLGLTATPPDRRGHDPQDVQRYDAFFGPVDFEVPVPSVVKDGFLAPYQDLVQFVRPTSDELAFIANADVQLRELVEELCRLDGDDRQPLQNARRSDRAAAAALTPTAPRNELPPRSAQSDSFGENVNSAAAPSARESLGAWLIRVLRERRLPVGTAEDWQSFENRDGAFANAARWFLLGRGLPLPHGVPPPPARPPSSTDAPELQVLVPVIDRYVRHRLRASPHPADQQLAAGAISRLRVLGVQITETGTQVCASPVGRVLMLSRNKIAAVLPILRAEKLALGDRLRAVVITDFEKTSAVSSEVGHLLDEEAGGAIAAFRALVKDHEADELNPVLVTGSSVLVDDDLAPRFGEAAAAWLAKEGVDAAIAFGDEEGFKVMKGVGGEWCPRVYVEMITDLFQQGLTKCLVGTRGLLGEGWDAAKVNVLVDLTSVTTSTSVNQLRGRSLRLDLDDPAKLADNWDVVCVAPEFTKGLDDYARFIDKHNTLFGLTDDGAVEKGVGHVHAAFTEIRPEGIEDSMALLNAEMLERPLRRAAFRDLWRIGEPYHAQPIHAVEAGGGGGGGFPPFPGAASPWSGESLAAAVGEAVLGALREAGLLAAGVGTLHVGTRSGGYVRAFLRDADGSASALFGEALREALGPLENPRYVIPRYVDQVDETWLSRILPRVLGRYFRRTTRTMQMLHSVPAILGRNKELAAIYERHWNAHVSPGRAVFAQRGEGEELLRRALAEGGVPRLLVHRKEVFL